MTISAVLDGPVTHASSRSSSRIHRIEIHASFQAAECAWKRLGTDEHVSTPYQSYDFLTLWQEHVGARAGYTPFVVIAYDRGNEPLMVLPLVTHISRGMQVACFPGGKHANFNMALWQRKFIASATRREVEDIIDGIADHAKRPDVLALSQQPLQWNGLPNPFALLPRQPSVNECPLLTIAPKTAPPKRFGSSFRRRLNGKEKKLKELKGYRYVHAHTVEEAKLLLDMFFTLKPLRMAEQKLKNVFAEPGVEQFIRHACLDKLRDGDPAIALHGLICDDEVIAMFGGVGDKTQFSTMFNTYTVSPAQRHSPGLVLLRNIIDNYADRGRSKFDFGVGTDSYKLQFCKERLPLFDSYIPLTRKGRPGARLLSLIARIKRAIKQSPMAMKAASLLRQGVG